ncbi:aldehyde dehydrogenase family protein [Paraburkholderia humisilvae]|uniref:NAD/NADP-dependent betaine aldehyde dehydrogenase n=1 Tax=Paraburkholderia humisilvae TaxID=627669 RepID=A0A6J5DER6_9BURK|nr:aldehyde dehydrogenase family protein [Paraburkholderia humisilvae]CAB3751914.1 NAD/NADP-dependent betaine aldehyde dehydrogenase [Paraburkholderia humisilvae]
MTVPAEPIQTIDAADLLARQRSAFLREGPPALAQRKARLARLRTAVLAYRSELKEAISADFGHRSHHEMDLMERVYALVHEDDLDAFVTQFDAMVTRSYPEGPTSNDYTSIVSDRHYDRLVALVDDARRRGARIVEAGVRPGTATTRARTLAPTLVVGAADESAIMQEEIFGPILAVRTYRHMDEVIDYVNARPRPLALYYFGNEDGECETLLKRTISGNTGITNTLMHVAQDDLPFGGVGSSGMGAYQGIEGFRAMSHAKRVFVQGRWNLPSLLRAPFGKVVDLALTVTLGTGRKRPH